MKAAPVQGLKVGNGGSMLVSFRAAAAANASNHSVLFVNAAALTHMPTIFLQNARAGDEWLLHFFRDSVNLRAGSNT